MSFKIKPRKKIKRRGNRLIVTRGEHRCVYTLDESVGWRMAEMTSPGEQYSVSHILCGGYVLAVGTREGEPLQFISETNSSEFVAARHTDAEPWVFFKDGEPFVSIIDTGIANIALAVSAVVATLNNDLAAFLKVHPALCRVSDIDEIHLNPRLKALRKFVFKVARPDGSVGTGRRAETAFRHRATNYEDMLHEGAKDVGGILYPAEYERVRKGVDCIVTNELRRLARLPA